MYRGVYGPLQVFGHRDLSPDKNGDGKIDSRDWVKACPSFDVRAWLASV
jgi:N-acetyl-anhydromuramyl-L-alanine amidase AmpD